jgi:hypothetical protein
VQHPSNWKIFNSDIQQISIHQIEDVIDSHSQQQLTDLMNRKLSAKMVISNTLGQHESYFIFKTLPKTSFIEVKVHKKRGVIFCPPPFYPTFLSGKKTSDIAGCDKQSPFIINSNRSFQQMNTRHNHHFYQR